VADPGPSNATVLAVLPEAEDRMALTGILRRPGWKLRAAGTFGKARLLLNRSSIGVVISERAFPDGRGWRDLLGVIQGMPDPPPLIVADRLADERLWAEVLNLGGYDLLPKPFAAKEVLHAVSAACRWRESRHRPVAAPLETRGRRGTPAAMIRPAC